MIPSQNILFIIATISLVSAACTSSELRGHLKHAGLYPLLPGDQGFAGNSSACMLLRPPACYCLMYAQLLTPIFFTVNLRFNIIPAAIVCPSSASQVSGAVKVGVTCDLPVVARSGGVRIFFGISLRCLTEHLIYQ